jgi:uncharacterized damage-inducible protein DinB
MRAQDLIREQFKMAHNVVEQVIDDCSPETLTKVVDGNVGSISAIYAHAVYDEDNWIAGSSGGTKIWESGGWGAKLGLEMPGPRQSEEWARSGPDYDHAAFREYAQAVYEQTDSFMAGLSDEGIDAEVDSPFGKVPLGVNIGAFALWHTVSHQGEIAAMKGVQGLKGLPY